MLTIFPQCNFSLEFQKYSVKIFYAIITWVHLEFPQIMHCEKVEYSLTCPIKDKYLPRNKYNHEENVHEMIPHKTYRKLREFWKFLFMQRSKFYIADNWIYTDVVGLRKWNQFNTKSVWWDWSLNVRALWGCSQYNVWEKTGFVSKLYL